jgi:hypothetical protein
VVSASRMASLYPLPQLNKKQRTCITLHQRGPDLLWTLCPSNNKNIITFTSGTHSSNKGDGSHWIHIQSFIHVNLAVLQNPTNKPIQITHIPKVDLPPFSAFGTEAAQAIEMAQSGSDTSMEEQQYETLTGPDTSERYLICFTEDYFNCLTMDDEMSIYAELTANPTRHVSRFLRFR